MSIFGWKRRKMAQYFSNRCKDVFKPKYYFGVRCSLKNENLWQPGFLISFSRLICSCIDHHYNYGVHILILFVSAIACNTFIQFQTSHGKFYKCFAKSKSKRNKYYSLKLISSKPLAPSLVRYLFLFVPIRSIKGSLIFAISPFSEVTLSIFFGLTSFDWLIDWLIGSLDWHD